MIKKAIVIVSAVIFTIYAIFLITFNILQIQGKLLTDVRWSEEGASGAIIVFLLVILVSSDAIFNRIPTKVTKKWLTAVSILSPLIAIFAFRLFLLSFMRHMKTFEWNALFIAFSLGSVVVIIKSVANIRRALKPAQK